MSGLNQPSNPYEADSNESWRSEVASRVNSFRARRKNRSDSMRLDFESAGSVPVVAEPSRGAVESRTRREVCDTNYYRRANAEAMGVTAPVEPPSMPVANFVETATAPAIEHVPEPEALSVETAPPVVMAPPIVEVEEPKKPVANVIVFPRPMIEPPLAPKPSDELAESIFERPRILDVPEDIVPAAQGNLFAEIHLDDDVEYEQQSQVQSSFEVPLRVAPAMSRFGAMMMDWLVVSAATVGFMALSWKAIAGLPHNKFTLPLLLVIPAVFWAVYQYLFLVYGGRTLGMEMSRLRVRNFDGELPTWKQRQQRAVHTVLSLGAVSMGYLWAVVDVDHLCWHDRVSKTYVTHE